MTAIERPPRDTAGAALRGPHARFAVGDPGGALRYPESMGGFASFGPVADPDTATGTDLPAAWAQLAAVPGPALGIFVDPEDPPVTAPDPWRITADFPLLCLIGPEVDPGDPEPGAGSGSARPAEGELVALTTADVPEMLALTELTKPGPFLEETIAFGGYVGIRRDGVLAAMAGRRMQTDGWIEVSAVCTHPDHRGAGLARRAMNAVIRGIRAEGAQPFLHVIETNPARHLYAAMGFTLGRETRIAVAERAAA